MVRKRKIEEVVRSFALRVDETIRKAIDCLSINKEKQKADTVVS